jgi:alpha-D-ribose 1-methylphosphonate 5-triphosphate diphosphatase
LADTVIERVYVVPGRGARSIESATVVVSDDGVVLDIAEDRGPATTVLVPAAVDLHLDNLRERRRPRATVELDQAGVVAMLDTECAAAGIGVVCIAARCEDAPGKGIVATDAVELASMMETLAPELACDWRLHVRVEVTDDAAVDALVQVLASSTRVALVSVMEHSIERSRFASAEEHRRFYAEDWSVSPEEVDTILAGKGAGHVDADDRRREVAALAASRGIILASHDDRHPDDVDKAFELGARIAEFPLSAEAARHALALGMRTVLGAPNAVRGRSTSPGNLLVADAVRDGLCDALCSDYLPSAMQEAPWALADRGAVGIGSAVDLVAANPAATLGIDEPRIEVGRPLTASLRRRAGNMRLGIAMWRSGQLVYHRARAADEPVRSLATR